MKLNLKYIGYGLLFLLIVFIIFLSMHKGSICWKDCDSYVNGKLVSGLEFEQLWKH
jgi:hypothetical protein